MGVSIKIALRNRANKEWLYPLIIRETKDRKLSIIHLGQFIDKKHWDVKERRVRKSHPNSKRLNSFLIKKLSEVNDVYFSKEINEEDFTALVVNEALQKEKSENQFFDEANEYLSFLKKEGT